MTSTFDQREDDTYEKCDMEQPLLKTSKTFKRIQIRLE